MIYLVAARSLAICKIGYAVNAENRLRVIQTASPFDLDLVAVREGGRLLEAAVHRAAREHRIKREWFAFKHEVLAVFHDTPAPKERGRIILPKDGMSKFMTWPLIDGVAEALGAKKPARTKWRVNGVPPKWQISIMRKLMADGIIVSLSDFDNLTPETASA